MPGIVTVLGEIAPVRLQHCQCHEHILLRKGQPYKVNPALCMDDFQKSREELNEYFAAGGRSIVDAQPVGCGRMADGLLELSRKTGIHIIASTGFHKLSFYPKDHWIFQWSARMLADLYIRELTEGMYADGDTAEPKNQLSCRAGQVKTALDAEGLSERYSRMFLAAADAVKATGAPMMIHVENGADPRRLLWFLSEQGIVPGQLIFCHMDRACRNIEWHKEIAGAGAYLEYDTIGRYKYHSDEKELDIMNELIEGGYGRRILFSLDTTGERLKAYGGSIGLTYILEKFIPLMRKRGITGETIYDISVSNSAEALAWKR